MEPIPWPVDAADDEVRLRPVSDPDVPGYVAAFVDDPALAELIGIEWTPDEEGLAEQRRRAEEGRRTGRFIELAVADARTDAFLGSVVLTRFEWRHRRAEVGVWLAPRARGQGLAARAVTLLVQWAWEELDLERLELMTFPENPGTPALATRLGFVREGLLRRRDFERGRRVDLLAAAQLAFLQGLVLPVVAPVLALALGMGGAVLAGQVTEARERRRVTRRNEALEAVVRERTRELRETQLEIVRRLGQAAEHRDRETGQHIDRIGLLSHRLALAAEVEPAEAELMRHASAMHDVGKIGLPDAILLKPGPLDAGERAAMQEHTRMGARILGGSSSHLLELAELIALTHHEKWDGTGYPAGLAGEEIPLAGRICAICDVFDALLSMRPYKPPWSLEDCLDELREQRGHHFDPRLLDLFLALVPDLPAELTGATAPQASLAPFAPPVASAR